MAKTAERKDPRAYGPHGNGAKPLEIDSLVAAGLAPIRILRTEPEIKRGQFYASVTIDELVVPVRELPSYAHLGNAPKRCLACRDTSFRLNQAADGWVCVRCHP